MRRLIGNICMLIISIGCGNILFSQYDGLENSHSVSKKNYVSKRNDTSVTEFGDTVIREVFKEDKPEFWDNFSKFNGVETFFSPIIVSELYLDAGPFVGTYFKNNLLLAAGPQATVYLAFAGSGTFSGGAFAFARINIGRVFIQPEYRITNTYVPSEGTRQWVASPVILGGILSNGKSQWVSAGLILNAKLSESSPFGAFVFRYGFQFN